MAIGLQTWNDSDVLWSDTFTTWGGGAIVCKFYMRDNHLIAISGADAGTYEIHDNYADIAVSGIIYRRSPFDPTISVIGADQVIYITIKE